MMIIDPSEVGLFDSSIERVVPLGEHVPSSFTFDSLPPRAKRANSRLSTDRYELALSMLDSGSGVCLDACTNDPRPDVKQAIEKKGYEYKAIDLCAGGGVRIEDLTKLSFSDGSIARIISCDTIEHIPSYPSAAREMFRVLAPGGLAILHFPVYYFDRPKGTPIIPTADPWGHVRYFSAREMIELFDQIGFAVLRASLHFDYGALLVALSIPTK
jgi:SAM-dependent methyltransferase